MQKPNQTKSPNYLPKITHIISEKIKHLRKLIKEPNIVQSKPNKVKSKILTQLKTSNKYANVKFKHKSKFKSPKHKHITQITPNPNRKQLVIKAPTKLKKQKQTNINTQPSNNTNKLNPKITNL